MKQDFINKLSPLFTEKLSGALRLIAGLHVCMVAAIMIAAIFPADASVMREPEFKSVTGVSGIPMYGITSLAQDDDGFIWAASRTGVMRATPSDCRLYDLPVATSDVMQVKLAYRGGVLLLSTQNGQIFRYNRVADRFEMWLNLSGQLGSGEWVTNLAIGPGGRAWISTSKGVYVASEEGLVLIRSGKSGYAYAVPMGDGSFFCVIDSGFYKVEGSTLKTARLDGGFGEYISAAAYDPFGRRIFIGTYQGRLLEYDLSSRQISESGKGLPRGLIVRNILIPDDRSLYIGVEGFGIVLTDRDGKTVRHVMKEDIDNPGSLRGNSVYALLFDACKRLWTSTTSGGLQYAETELSAIEHVSHVINDPRSLCNNEVNDIMTDRDGRLWLATNDGAGVRDNESGEWTTFLGGRQLSVLSLASDMDGRVYVSTYGEGVYVIDGESGKTLRHFTKEHGDIFGPGSFVFSSFRDSDGDIWFGGVKGDVVCYHVSDGTFEAYGPSPVFCFSELSPGRILTGGGGGLTCIDKRGGSSETLLPGNVIHNITLSGDTVWVCTSGNGVIGINADTGEETRLTTKEGLHSNFTRSMLRSGDRLWISTDKGMSCYDLAKGEMLLLPGRDILSRSVFNNDASSMLPDGRLAFGTNNGVIIFHPDSVAELKTKGRIYFSDIRVSGRSIRENHASPLSVPIDSLAELRLDYPYNSFTLSVLPLGDVSQMAGYSWKLVGQDREWSEISPLSYINYVNLKPGDYILMVRMYDGGMLSEREFGITVTPPFWQTLWFRLSVVILVAIILILSVRHYLWRMHRKYTSEKIRFFTRMAHDLRTSLMLMKAPVDELRKEENLSEWGGRCLGMAAEQAERLNDTVTRLLDFEKLDIGAGQPEFVKTDIAALFKRRGEIYESYAASKNIRFEMVSAPEEYFTDVDRKMMERVIDNLLSNAVKYSNPGGSVSVEFSGSDKEWRLKVEDNGIGISKSDRRKLFREFYRGENAVNSQAIGSGIGLLMVKRYVRLHKGDVVVESAPGKGTVFQLTVPRRCRRQENVSQEISHGDGGAVTAPVNDLLPENNDMEILIVEDNVMLREFMVRALQTRFNVYAAGDGEEALRTVRERQPDLVLTDVMMPGIDGFELCRRIKTDPSTSHIPVIMLTSLSDKSDQIHGLGVGADNYLVKPFDMDLLAGRIISLILNRRNVMRKALEVSESGDDSAIVENHINDEFLKKALKCVKDNISNESFGKGDFASAMAISQSLLYKKIKALTGLSVVEFIRSIRLSHAMELLRHGGYNVTEVSEMCGFSTPAYFSRVFKDHFGKNPSDI